MPVAASQRYTRESPCPICRGHSRMRKGHGQRCWGFVSECGTWARCTRPEFAGAAPDRGGYVHKTNGDCFCGVSHGGWVAPLPPQPKTSRNSEYANQIWRESVAASGTVVESYLKTRGITLQPPPYLRFHPALSHSDAVGLQAAMVAAVAVWPSCEITGIQRTYLKVDGSGKGEVEPNKMSLGITAGGAVRLSEAGTVLGLAEGLETALSIQQELGVPCWAVLGARNFPNVVLPALPVASEVHLYADGDNESRDSIVDAAEIFLAQGRIVKVFPAPQDQDFNDVLVGAL